MARKVFLCVCLMGLFVFGSAFIQAQTLGSILGTVTDETGIAVPGVYVTVSGPNLMQDRYANTNENGRYRISAVPAGMYKVSAELQGFLKVIKENVQVTRGQTTTEDFVLTIQESESVSCVSAVGIVKGETSGGTVFSAEILESLPTIGEVPDDVVITFGAPFSPMSPADPLSA